MTNMNLASKTALLALLVSASASVMAAPHLTLQECNDYPFKPLKSEVTHAQLEQELAELEAVGYDPSQDDEEYPNDLQIAEGKVQSEYRRDCRPSAAMTETQSSSGVAAPAPANSPAS
jgi:hypothetical protein